MEPVSNSEDNHSGWRGGPYPGGWWGLDPATGGHQDPAQEQSSDAHQRPGTKERGRFIMEH